MLSRAHQGQAGSYGPVRVVVPHARDAEQDHRGVSDELLHPAPIAVHRLRHRVEVGRLDAGDVLMVEGLREGRKSHQVGEQDRDGPPLLRDRADCERTSAVPAESETVRALFPAPWADQHGKGGRSDLGGVGAGRGQYFESTKLITPYARFAVSVSLIHRSHGPFLRARQPMSAGRVSEPNHSTSRPTLPTANSQGARMTKT